MRTTGAVWCGVPTQPRRVGPSAWWPSSRPPTPRERAAQSPPPGRPDALVQPPKEGEAEAAAGRQRRARVCCTAPALPSPALDSRSEQQAGCASRERRGAALRPWRVVALPLAAAGSDSATGGHGESAAADAQRSAHRPQASAGLSPFMRSVLGLHDPPPPPGNESPSGDWPARKWPYWGRQAGRTPSFTIWLKAKKEVWAHQRHRRQGTSFPCGRSVAPTLTLRGQAGCTSSAPRPSRRAAPPLRGVPLGALPPPPSQRIPGAPRPTLVTACNPSGSCG